MYFISAVTTWHLLDIHQYLHVHINTCSLEGHPSDQSVLMTLNNIVWKLTDLNDSVWKRDAEKSDSARAKVSGINSSYWVVLFSFLVAQKIMMHLSTEGVFDLIQYCYTCLLGVIGPLQRGTRAGRRVLGSRQGAPVSGCLSSPEFQKSGLREAVWHVVLLVPFRWRSTTTVRRSLGPQPRELQAAG